MADPNAPQPQAGLGGYCAEHPTPDKSWDWTYWDVVVWKVLPVRIGGNPNRLRAYKDAWVHAHRDSITRLAALYSLPPELLAGVAWIELGGKPYSSKLLVYDARRFDHSGDPLVEPLTITKKPAMTSVGPIAIQLRRAAQTIGVDYDSLNSDDKDRLVQCLLNGDSNLAIVARHLWLLKEIDFPGQSNIGPDEIRIIGARYNRGPDLPLAKIKLDTSYGDFIVKRMDKLRDLLRE